MEHQGEMLRVYRWRPVALSWRDLVAAAIVLSCLVLIGQGTRQMLAPLPVAGTAPISLSPAELPWCALRSTLRMLAALVASLLFTFTYATLAAKSRRAEMVLIPLLDVLQSVPILGYLSFTAAFLVSLSPRRQLGAEAAAIFAIFTSQAWNMAFSLYQSLRTVPVELNEACRSFRLSAWQRFWRLEVPFALPGLLWNTMMSMSGGWFFVVASEAITVGALEIRLPGIGSYVARAIELRDLGAVAWAVVAMLLTIMAYDQLLFRPLVAWADKFRVETTAGQVAPRSALLDLCRRSPLCARAQRGLARAVTRIAHARLDLPKAWTRWPRPLSSRSTDVLWGLLVASAAAISLLFLGRSAAASLAWSDVATALSSGWLTFSRVAVLIALATVIWVPLGVAIGLRPRLAERVQPAAQFFAAFPVNLLFPAVVFAIVDFGLTPKFWLPPLMILGTQWYILFNVIAGAAALPNDLREAAGSCRLSGWRWWRRLALPGIFPYYVTGAITASGGAWNASIVSEAVSWGRTKLSAGGLGAYIAERTAAGDFAHIALGVATMSAFVIALNRLLWRPMYAFAERRTRLD